MILFQRNISANPSYISFYTSNEYVELWMKAMESSDPIEQRHEIFAYYRKQDQDKKTVILFSSKGTLHMYESLCIKNTLRIRRILTNMHWKERSHESRKKSKEQQL